MERWIVHLDADAFFASVEQAADVRLRGRPVAVGGQRRGVIASASYEARRYGIHTSMPTALARRLCPHLIVLPGDFEKYERFSRWMFSYAYDFTPEVEQTSIDEGYLDVTACRSCPPVEVAQRLRQIIRQALKLSVSEGLGSSKLVSQIAAKLHKPAAFCTVPPGRETDFLHPLPVHWLPGVGPQTAPRLRAAGLYRIWQVAATPPEQLELLVGSKAFELHRFARGLDDRPLIPQSLPQQSYQQQMTFDQDCTDELYVAAVLRQMADTLFARVRAEGRSVRTFTVKVTYSDMAEDRAAESLEEPTAVETVIYSRLDGLLRRAWQRRVALRRVGLKLSDIYDGIWDAPLPLTAEAQRQAACHRLARAVDELRHRLGPSALLRAHDLQLRDFSYPAAFRRVSSRVHLLARPSAREFFIHRTHPVSTPSPRLPSVGSPLILSRTQAAPPYIPLRVRSCYSFLDSTLTPAAIVAMAQQYECPAVALVDLGNLHGAVAFTEAALQAGIQPILGAEIPLEGSPLLLYVESAQGYVNLCRLLSDRSESSLSHLTGQGTGKGGPVEAEHSTAPDSETVSGQSVVHRQRRNRTREELEGRTEGLIAVSADPRWADLFPGRFYRAIANRLHPESHTEAAFALCPPIHYGSPKDRQFYEVLQSIRTCTLVGRSHPRKRSGGSLHFRSPAEMDQLGHGFGNWRAVAEEIAARCQFTLSRRQPQFPPYHPPEGGSPGAFLRRLVEEGLHRRYGRRGACTPQGRRISLEELHVRVEEELNVIAAVGYEEYFLIVWELLERCRRRGIEWITRGSAADSLVCYCLGISNVCPVRFGLYFRRFLNLERMQMHKLPDIDVDFPHDRKDEVVADLLQQYGPNHAAVVGGFSTFRVRAAVAEVAKVLGTPEGIVRRWTERLPWSLGGEQPYAGTLPHEAELGEDSPWVEHLRSLPECRDIPLEEEPLRTAIALGARLAGLPRYPKMHPCGVVLSRQPMMELTPTFRSAKGWPTTHFDMDAVEAVGLVKLDLLAQGGLSVLRDVKANLNARGLVVDLERFTVQGKPIAPDASATVCSRLSSISEASFDDRRVWTMIANGNARAVHHIESPAMTSLCRMSQVHDIEGLIALVSVIRPGAANEQNKLRFTRRYQGMEPVTYPHPILAECLGDSWGLVLYEEHVLLICERFAGLSPGRADQLRRALSRGQMPLVDAIGQEFCQSARARGHPEEVIAAVWAMVRGFAGYSFCKAHSTAYAVEAYQSAWLKCYFPAEFMAAVLTHGKGFYDPLVYVLECHRMGIPLLRPDVNRPGPSFEVEHHPHPAIRVPLTQLKGLTEPTRDRLLSESNRAPFVSLADFYERVRPLPEELEAMIRVGAFDGWGLSRTDLFWEAQRLIRRFSSPAFPTQGWLFPEWAPGGNAPRPDFPSSRALLQQPTLQERLADELEWLGFPVSAHPLALHSHVAWETYCPVACLAEHRGQRVTTCGLVVEQRIHHQLTGEPMKFLTLADWTGMLETELFAASYRHYGSATVRYPVLEVTGTVEPFENGLGYTLRVEHAGPPRQRTQPAERTLLHPPQCPPSG
ncbi:MAG: DNA polymerase IV [Verrucomicrobiota bacterium]|nr:DNA polymerase IV [Limisphaera sp.]MDW8381921.1 DNA polymerase IV [Verrucomicrobiota bacterium]